MIATLRILITRPLPSAADTAAELDAKGYDTLVAPVLVARSRPPVGIDLDGGEHLIVTSPQAARALEDWRGLHAQPAIAVGARTAAILSEGGFAQVRSVDGDAAAIVADLSLQPAQRCVLACAPTTGEWLDEKLQAAGHQVRRISVYDIEAADHLPAPAIAALDDHSLTHVLFYSAFTAKTFLRLVSQANRIENLADLTACCLSPAVAQAAGAAAWQQILTAVAPDSHSLQHLLPAVRSAYDRTRR